MKVMVLGSCRVYDPLKNYRETVLFKGGRVHTSTQIIQAFNIMSGNLKIPQDIFKYALRGTEKKTYLIYDFLEIDFFIMEICSVKNFYFNNYNSISLGTDRWAKKDKFKEKIIIRKETNDELFYNLNKINLIINRKPCLFVSHNNIPNLENRDLLINNLSLWCEKNDKYFLDPTGLIKKYGVRKCFKPKNDCNHYSRNFRREMRRYFKTFLKELKI